jgi:preprotein translocase subunit SecB
LRFIDFSVDFISFARNYDFQTNDPIPLDCELNHKIAYQESEAHVSLAANLFKNAVEKKYPFKLSVGITGIFEVEDIKDAEQKKLLEINATTILFPYLRSLISTITVNAQLPALNLPPVNIVQMFKNAEKKEPLKQ